MYIVYGKNIYIYISNLQNTTYYIGLALSKFNIKYIHKKRHLFMIHA